MVSFIFWHLIGSLVFFWTNEKITIVNSVLEKRNRLDGMGVLYMF